MILKMGFYLPIYHSVFIAFKINTSEKNLNPFFLWNPLQLRFWIIFQKTKYVLKFRMICNLENSSKSIELISVLMRAKHHCRFTKRTLEQKLSLKSKFYFFVFYFTFQLQNYIFTKIRKKETWHIIFLTILDRLLI